MSEELKPRALQTEEERELNKLIFTEISEGNDKWGTDVVYRARKDGIEVFVGREKESYKWIVHVTTQLDYKKPVDTSLEDAFILAEKMFEKVDDTLNDMEL